MVPSFTRIGFARASAALRLAGRRVVVDGRPDRGHHRRRRRVSDGRPPGRSPGWAPGSSWSAGIARRLERTRDELVAETPRRGRRPSSPTCRPSRRSARPPTRSSTWRRGSTSSSTTPARCTRPREVSADGIERTFATMVRRAVRPHRPAVAPARRRPRTPGSWRSPRAGCTRSGLPLDDLGFEHGTYDGRARLRPGEARPGRARPRVGAATRGRMASSSTRCIRAGPTRPGSRRRCRGSAPLIGGLLRSPAEGADTIVWLAAAPEARASDRARSSSTGGSARSTACPATRLSAADRRDLWDQVVALSGEADPMSSGHRAGRPPRS